MKNTAQQPNENLLNDAMSTPSLDAFYDNIEQQFVSRMESSAPVMPTNGSFRKWLGFGGIATALILVTTAMVYYANRNNAEPVVSPSSAPTPSTSPATTTTTAPPIAPLPEQRAVPEQSSTQKAEPLRVVGSSSVASVTAQAQSTRTLSAATQHDIDSLNEALTIAASRSDAARIGYQLGLRYRIAGNYAMALDHLITSSTIAQQVGAHLLAAKGRQQAAKAAMQLGDKTLATTLFGQALNMLPASEDELRSRWNEELDSIQR